MLSNGYFYPREGLHLLNRFSTYAALYRAQPAIATVVDKVANSAARLSPKVWNVQKLGGRTWERDSAFARLVRRPCTELSPFVFWRWVFATYEVYGEAFLLKQRNDAGRVTNLLPMHPSRVIVTRNSEGEVRYKFTVGVASSGLLDVSADDVIPIVRWNPESLMRGMSRLEPLAITLSAEDAARRATSSWWQRGARPSVILSHPGELSAPAMERLGNEFDARHGGANNMGGTAVLEEGMTATVVQLNAEEMQYIESRKLNMAEVCMVYDVPPPVVHILDHATFSNITEQMRSMYRDTMSPRLEDVESIIDSALTAEFYPDGSREFEFDMTDVLRGDFESRATSSESLRNTGIATGNESREIMGLPRSADPMMDKLFANAALVELGTPAQRITVNAAQPQTPAQQAEAAHTEQGGADAAASAVAAGEKIYTAAPHRLAVKPLAVEGGKSYTVRSLMGRIAHKSGTRDEVRARLIEEHEAALADYFERQKAAATRAVATKAATADLTSFDFELSGLLEALGTATAKAVGDRVASDLGGTFDATAVASRITGNAKAAASIINRTTAEEITKALTGPLEPAEAVSGLFDGRVTARAGQIATTRVAVVAGFVAQTAAKQCGATQKTWTVNSGNPRPEHEEMDGESVGISDTFSNGMDGPGDFAGGVDEVAGCTCDLEFS